MKFSLPLALSFLLLLSQNPAAAWDVPVFDIPRVEGIELAFDERGWGEQGMTVPALVGDDPIPVRARVGWDDRGLLILVTVQDTSLQIAENPGALYEADSVEIFLSPVHHNAGPKVDYEQRDVYQLLCSPEGNGFYVYDSRLGAKRALTPTPVVRSRRLPGGYQTAIRIPWADLGGKPDTVFGLQIHVNDIRDGKLSQVRWNAAAGRGQSVRISAGPGKTPRLAASGRYEGMDTIAISVAAAPDLAGEVIEVRAGDRVIASGKLESSGRTSLRWPAGPNAPTSVAVFFRKEPQAVIELPGLEKVRADALRSLQWVPTPGTVFTGPEFPAGHWSDVNLGEALLDPESVQVTFYDAGLHPVTRAEKPGRYTAFVSAKARGGEPVRRTLTFFRAADGFDVSSGAYPDAASAAVAAGISADVVAAHAGWVRGMLDPDPAEARRLRSTFAAQLSALSEASAVGAALSSRAAEENVIYLIRKLRDEALALRCIITPTKGLDPATAKNLTLVLFLHGTGNGNEKNAMSAPIRRYAMEHSDPPFLLVQPLCPPGTAWVPAQVNDFLNELAEKYSIDPNRIYATGFSMGGFGTWNLGIFYPGRFAALAPLAAYGETGAAPAIGKTPVFAWHGDRDAIHWQRHRETVDALNAAGGRGSLTLLPDINHTNTEEAVYSKPEFYRALLKNKRADQRSED
jgi:hypothetical protein